MNFNTVDPKYRILDDTSGPCKTSLPWLWRSPPVLPRPHKAGVQVRSARQDRGISFRSAVSNPKSYSYGSLSSGFLPLFPENDFSHPWKYMTWQRRVQSSVTGYIYILHFHVNLQITCYIYKLQLHLQFTGYSYRLVYIYIHRLYLQVTFTSPEWLKKTAAADHF